VTPAAEGQAFNVGAERALTLRELADTLIEANGRGSFVVKEFPAERKRIDIGDYWADDRLFRSVTGWQPRVPIGIGLKKALDFFSTRLTTYV